jgi:hypothetical protein
VVWTRARWVRGNVEMEAVVEVGIEVILILVGCVCGWCRRFGACCCIGVSEEEKVEMGVTVGSEAKDV